MKDFLQAAQKENRMKATRTAMIDLRIDVNNFSDPGFRTKIIEVTEEVLSPLSAQKKHETAIGGSYLVVYSNQDGSLTCILKSYPSGLVTLTFEDCLEEGGLTNSKLEQLRKVLHSKLKIKADKIPIVKRGLAVPVYFTTAEERFLECDFDKVVYETESSFQNIKILHSPTYGNSLILDDLQNLADSDISYTRGVMKYGIISYTGKEVLVLGGGDGGLLHEILKENPKFITMVEIDRTVVDACREHLRGCCGDSFDKLEGDNYHVIIDDCFKKLDEYKSEGRSFDIIINDLTDIPITTLCQGESWDFVRKIITKSFDVLRPDGSYLNHALCESFVEPLKMYEDMLSSLPFKVTFERKSSYVPSYIGKWVFYEVKRV